MPADKFQISFKSDVNTVRYIVQDALHFIKENVLECDEEAYSDLKLVFSELLFNAVIHGNKYDSNKHVHLKLRVKFGNVYGVVSDEGTGFDYNKLILGFDTNDNLYEENGRGIRLVLSLVDKAGFNVAGNQIEFQKRVARYG